MIPGIHRIGRARAAVCMAIVACVSLVIGLAVAAARAEAQTSAAASAPEQTVSAYRRSLEVLKPQEATSLFATDAEIFEGGSAEGRPADYFAHHLLPEFAQLQSFQLSDVVQKVVQSGDIAWVSETYNYRAILKSDGRQIEGKGVSTYVLRRIENAWRIQMLHVSSRRQGGAR